MHLSVWTQVWKGGPPLDLVQNRKRVLQVTEEIEGYATKCQPAQGEGTVPGPLCTLCMCNLNIESHDELGAKFVHTA